MRAAQEYNKRRKSCFHQRLCAAKQHQNRFSSMYQYHTPQQKWRILDAMLANVFVFFSR
jgi:hypothetical protein